MQGRKVFNSSFYQDKGIQSKSIDLRTIASGTYILTLYDDKGSVVHTQKIRKQ
ncbi:MAG: T9SS type A sorting domain-containing protein [Bacteroidetes bacterium]|nr:T9SS type A sorting domain-containing protein [Bacteroidota bacterium]